MRIRAQVEVATELYEKHYETFKHELKHELRGNVCKELMKHDVLIEPPTISGRTGYTTIEMHFFALSYSDIDKLRELIDKYPEMEKILLDIIVKA